MPYYVYMIKTIQGKQNKTYVGYTNDIKTRIKKHNENKGAKATKGYKWKIIYSKRFKNKSKAMSYEYFLKKNRRKRIEIIKNSIKK